MLKNEKHAYRITYEIVHRGFDLDYGPFSYDAMGGNAVEVISEECYDALFCGEWHWKPTRELSSMLIQKRGRLHLGIGLCFMKKRGWN